MGPIVISNAIHALTRAFDGFTLLCFGEYPRNEGSDSGDRFRRVGPEAAPSFSYSAAASLSISLMAALHRVQRYAGPHGAEADESHVHDFLPDRRQQLLCRDQLAHAVRMVFLEDIAILRPFIKRTHMDLGALRADTPGYLQR